MSLKVGNKAPDFSLYSDENLLLSLSDLLGKKVILYFYPKDNTPGCTTQAKHFRDISPIYQEYNAVILGVSKDSVDSHFKFKLKHSLPFNLLSDPDAVVCKNYGVLAEKSMFGKKYLGITRSTFLIDEQGKLCYIWPKVTVSSHAQEVLEQLQELKV